MESRVYLVLGTTGAGRREIISKLIEDVEGDGTILINNKEQPNDIACKSWALENGKVVIADNELEGDIYFLTTIEEDLIDQIEAFKKWLDRHNDMDLARVFAIIDCELASKTEELAPWFDAIMYFADCVLLTKWKSTPNKWLTDYQKALDKKAYPCIVERIKDGQASNPYMMLEPQARRISFLFDGLDAIDTLEIDEDNLPEGPFELKVKEDRYLERTEEGTRMIPLPNPKDYL